jgi:hypothetical protein
MPRRVFVLLFPDGQAEYTARIGLEMDSISAAKGGEALIALARKVLAARGGIYATIFARRPSSLNEYIILETDRIPLQSLDGLMPQLSPYFTN